MLAVELKVDRHHGVGGAAMLLLPLGGVVCDVPDLGVLEDGAVKLGCISRLIAEGNAGSERASRHCEDCWERKG